jgi:two-component system chemotaxis response regulator CheB
VIAPASLQGRVDAIAIGASAGGIDALGRLLPALPASMPVPVFVVLHLPRERPSLLVDIFAPRCAMRIREAQDKEPVAAGTVYFAPPDYHLLLDRSDAGPALALSSDEPVNYSRPSIDVLFESLGDAYGARVAAAVLTGASQDGAEGLAAVQRAGGVTIVQRPDDAQVSLMAEAALARLTPDWVLTLDEILEILLTLPETTT